MRKKTHNTAYTNIALPLNHVGPTLILNFMTIGKGMCGCNRQMDRQTDKQTDEMPNKCQNKDLPLLGQLMLGIDIQSKKTQLIQ